MARYSISMIFFFSSHHILWASLYLCSNYKVCGRRNLTCLLGFCQRSCSGCVSQPKKNLVVGWITQGPTRHPLASANLPGSLSAFVQAPLVTETNAAVAFAWKVSTRVRSVSSWSALTTWSPVSKYKDISFYIMRHPSSGETIKSIKKWWSSLVDGPWSFDCPRFLPPFHFATLPIKLSLGQLPYPRTLKTAGESDTALREPSSVAIGQPMSFWVPWLCVRHLGSVTEVHFATGCDPAVISTVPVNSGAET